MKLPVNFLYILSSSFSQIATAAEVHDSVDLKTKSNAPAV